MNLDFARVCGKHNLIYEAYYKQIDPKGTGAIEAMTAAKFLKKSGLSDVVLSRIWDLSDPNGKGFLDKPGFFVALKLVSLSQAGQVGNMNNIYMDTVNPPKVGEIPKALPTRIQTVPVPASAGATSGDWSISVIDRLKYEQLFESLSPQNGMLPGNKVKGVLMDSKLPMNILGTIWDLADQDKDGNLDKHEFIVAMHLVYQTLQKRTIPSVLPPELRKAPKPAMPPPPVLAAAGGVGAAMPRAPSGEGFGDGGFVANFPKDIAPPAAIPPLPVAVPPMTRIPPVGAVSSQPLIQTDPLIPIGAPPSVTANADWVVSTTELLRFEEIFRQSDLDKDGLVSGLEVKDIFIKSGIPQRSLADIWALCDTNQSGKLTVEQFALAMWLVERKQRGVDPPQVLTANMVPPSMRAIVSGVDVQPQETKPTYSNPELEMISKEIEELARERRALETEIAQKEADVRIKNGEVRSLQSELDTLTATLKQLENQRGEAQKRLDDLQAQVVIQNLAEMANVSHDINYTNDQVNKIRDQCHKQEETINEQEGELNAKRSELQKLKDEESALQKEYDENNRELSKLTKHLQNTQLQISSVRSMVTQLMETQRQMTDALLICRAAMENQNAELVSEYQLKIEPDFDDARKTLQKEIEAPKEDPFDENNSGAANRATNGFDNDPFSGQGNKPIPAISGGFDDSFNNSGFDSGFDAFGHNNASSFGQTQRDPFGADTFGANKSNAITPEPGKDDFGSDPFAALHAPTGQGQVLSPNTQRSGPPPRPESPSPALPPKKSKVPPPRPAPPRASQPSSGFGSSAASGGGFADFDDFDNKLQNIPIKTQNTNSTTPIPAINATLLSLFDAPQSKPSLSKAASTSTGTATGTTPATAKATATTTQPLHPQSASTLLLTPSTSASASTTTLASASASVSASASASAAATTNNPHLSRSNTPLQTAGLTDIRFDAFGASTAASPVPAIIQGPTDFKDDPFKDYRYEDPFNIKDPFADDDEGGNSKKNFAEDFSSEDEIAARSTNSHIKSKTATPLNSELLQQFDAFNLNPSPAPSHHSNASSAAKPASVTLDAFADADDFDLDKPVGSVSESTLIAAPSLTTTTTATTAAAAATTTTTSISNSNANAEKLNDSFFNAFNDNFNDNLDPLSAKSRTQTLGKERTNNNKFDAFAVSSSSATLPAAKDAKLFDAFNDNFEDIFKPANSTSLDSNNFAKFDAFGADNFGDVFQNASTHTQDNNFAKFENFDAFGSAFEGSAQKNGKNHNNNNHKDSKSNLSGAGSKASGKQTDKFAADYSKPESYDADLEEALKRSMLDN
ncbi:hypothetical protein KR222_008819 [Zaprionus bogoriensis]|nr:hypothetical protein KR222_008819 [Zaprionus bogoriensis]